MNKRKYGSVKMSDEEIETYLPKAEVPKKEYRMEAQDPGLTATKPINKIALYADLYALLYAAGGKAEGYKRELQKIIDRHL